MNNIKILVFGQKHFNFYNKHFIQFEFSKLLAKLKSQNSNIFVYSGLQEGAELDLAQVSIRNGIPTVGCIPFKNFHYKFAPQNQDLYRRIIPRLFSFTVISNMYSYKAYKQKADYLTIQCNCAICVWDRDEGHTKIFLNSLIHKWKGNKKPIYIIDYKSHTTSSISF